MLLAINHYYRGIDFVSSIRFDKANFNRFVGTNPTTIQARLSSASMPALAAALLASGIALPTDASAQTVTCTASPCPISGLVRGNNGEAAGNGGSGGRIPQRLILF